MAKESTEQKLLKMMNKPGSSVAAKPPSSKRSFKFSFNIATINALLFVGILACVLGLLWEMRSGFSLLHQAVEFPAESRNATSLSDIALPSAQDADYYLQQINQRDIFKPYVAKSAASAQAPAGLAQKMSRYKLVGVAWLDLPETASIMIEDTQKNKTLFLKQGEQLDGVTVKTIYTDRAVFSHENEETTIKL